MKPGQGRGASGNGNKHKQLATAWEPRSETNKSLRALPKWFIRNDISIFHRQVSVPPYGIRNA